MDENEPISGKLWPTLWGLSAQLLEQLYLHGFGIQEVNATHPLSPPLPCPLAKFKVFGHHWQLKVAVGEKEGQAFMVVIPGCGAAQRQWVLQLCYQVTSPPTVVSHPSCMLLLL